VLRPFTCAVLTLLLSHAAGISGRQAGADEVPPELGAYVSQTDSTFEWKLLETPKISGQRGYHLELTSQKWQGITWKHNLLICEPQQVAHTDSMLLFVTGGRNGSGPRDQDFALGQMLAEACGARVAVLSQVPNQPLLGDRYEDDLITETWLRYLKTGDASWPLLFPMVKSAVRAMDALQEFSRTELGTEVRSFVVSGASKRGWTSWLSAAADSRIIGIAPMVIDVLNFSKQMKHQKETWGFYSEQIIDYTSKGLVREDGIPREGREAHLWKMMDPFRYRSALTLPKLLVVGANDRYWTVDAMNLYWDDLQGGKLIHRAPNAGHSLDGGREGAVRTVGAFFRHLATGTPFPRMTWDWKIADGVITMTVTSDQQGSAAMLWNAVSETADFRESEWQPYEMTCDKKNVWKVSVPASKDRRTAFFATMDHEIHGVKYSLSTLAYWK